MPTETKAKFVRVSCPVCRSTYKVSETDAESYAATLPAECETCHPPKSASIGPSPIPNDQSAEQISILLSRVAALESGQTSLRQDVAALLDAVTKNVSRTN